MTGWTITCDSGGECPASINQETGLAEFKANTGAKDIIYTITYTDENGNCGSTTIRQPGNCSSPEPPPAPVGACDFIQEITTIPYTEYDGIVVRFSTNKCSLTIDNVRVNQNFVTISSIEGGNINVHVDANPNEQNTRPFKISLTASTTGEEEEEVTAEFNFTQSGKQSPSSDVERWLSQLVCEESVPCSNSISNPITITIKVKNAYSYDMLYNGRFHMPLQEIESYTDKGPIYYSFDANTRHAWCDRGSARFSYCDDTNLILREGATLEWTTQIDGKYSGKHIDMSQNPRLYMGVTDLNDSDHYIHAISYPDMEAYLTLDNGISTTISDNGTYSFTLTGTPSYKYDGDQAFHKDEGKAGYLKHVGSSGTVRIAPISIKYWNDNYNG